MKIAVVSKPAATGDSTRQTITSYLEKSGCELVFCDLHSTSVCDRLSQVDAILVFGGDGTILMTVKRLDGQDVPILGVNLGNLGFLTAFEGDASGSDVLSALKSKKYISRMLLDVDFGGDNTLALNDAVIKSATSRPIGLNVYVDDNYLDSYYGDGLIISTPVGSTAYSLSAGGPVLSPDVDAIILNPLCAHTLHARPIVLSASSKITVKLSSAASAMLSVDGEEVKTLAADSSFTVGKSKKSVKFVVADGDGFYKKLLQKMNSWGITHNN